MHQLQLVSQSFPCSTLFFNSLARSGNLSPFSFSVYPVVFSSQFALWLAGLAKSTIQQILFFLLIIIWSGRLTEIRWSVCISKSQRTLSVSFSMIDLGCAYTISSLFYSFERFSHQRWLMVSHWSLNKNKPPSVSRTLHSFLADLNALLWMVSTRPPISKSSCLFINDCTKRTNYYLYRSHFQSSIVFSVS